MKNIKIGEKEHQIDCNAYVQIDYRKIFNRGIIKDVQIVNKFIATQTLKYAELKAKNPEMSEEDILVKVSELTIDDLDEFVEVLTKITWILIYTVNKNIEDYETWLKGMTKIDISSKWVAEVTELAVSSFL